MSIDAKDTTGPLMFPKEPVRAFQAQDLDDLLIWATEVKASDITIQTREQVFIEVSNRMIRATKREWSHEETMNALAYMFGNESVKGTIARGEDKDFAYDLSVDRNTRYRFRVNAVGIMSKGAPGVQITLRTIPSIPPSLDDLGIEKDLKAALAPRNGMVVITGATGSGKSTLLAAQIRKLCEDPMGNRKIVTFESPIEFVYDAVDRPSTSLAQTQVPANLPSFTSGTRNALRRKPHVILVGEARDRESVQEAIVAAQTGHLLYTTVHSDNFSQTIPRMLSVFPEGERNARTVELVNALRVVVSQVLVAGINGGRVGLREYVIMTPEIADEILSQPFDKLPLVCREILRKHGQSFLQAAQRAYDAGQIDQQVLRSFMAADQAAELDAKAAAQVVENMQHASWHPEEDADEDQADQRLDGLG